MFNQTSLNLLLIYGDHINGPFVLAPIFLPSLVGLINIWGYLNRSVPLSYYISFGIG